MGSGRKSNGFRPVNKVDGPKKRGKKQMSKTRRRDERIVSSDEAREMSGMYEELIKRG